MSRLLYLFIIRINNNNNTNNNNIIRKLPVFISQLAMSSEYAY